MRNYLVVFLVSIAVFFAENSLAQRNWSPDHVYYGLGGELSYTPDSLGNIIPDFSHVGYKYGDEAIPEIATKVEVEPVDGDDLATIQAAINSVAAMPVDENGYRGAVLLKAGTYEVSGQIKINASGVVLRGEGQTDQGTVIIATGTDKRDLIKADNGASRNIDYSSKTKINESYVPVGRKYVVLSSVAGFNAGDDIVLYRPGTAQWISDIKMDQINQDGDVVQWSPSDYNFYFERKITKISGDTVFFRNPVVMAMEDKYGGGSVYKYTFNRLENIGVENFCLKSAYTSEEDEEHSWKAIAYYSVENSWIRNITSWYFSFGCVSLERNSKLNTVLNCHVKEPKSIITGGRRYSFYIRGSLGLFKDCTSSDARHDYASDSRVCGPNVFTNCTADTTHADIGPHHRWAMGTLYDLIVSDGQINVQDRDDMGTGHGWAGANQVFWNCAGSSSICQSPWASALNYNFGFIGDKSYGYKTNRPDGVWVGHNEPNVFPSSLYNAQLDHRVNNTSLFSTLNKLLAQNDTTFLMHFNKPVNTASIIKQNFSVGGTAGVEDKAFELEIVSESSVLFTFSEIGVLPAFSTIIIVANGVTSQSGEQLSGLTSSIYATPDLRPVVTGLELTVNNVDGFLVASSSKPGFIYVIKYGDIYKDADDLDSAVAKNLGRKVDAPNANVSVAISTKGLPGGFYNYYAVDELGRMSVPGTKWGQVEETGPVTGAKTTPLREDFAVWYTSNELCIKPEDISTNYEINLFDTGGKLLLKRTHLVGFQRISFNSYKGIVIVRKISPKAIKTRKLIIQ